MLLKLPKPVCDEADLSQELEPLGCCRMLEVDGTRSWTPMPMIMAAQCNTLTQNKVAAAALSIAFKPPEVLGRPSPGSI